MREVGLEKGKNKCTDTFAVEGWMQKEELLAAEGRPDQTRPDFERMTTEKSSSVYTS